MRLNPGQQQAVEFVTGPCLVLAGAGSGKTRVITNKIAHLIRGCGYQARHIAAVTFTNKAAREMKERVGQTLGRKEARGLMISTFHTLGLDIIKREYAALGMKSNFSLFDDTDQVALLKELTEGLIEDDKVVLQQLISTISNWKNDLKTPAQAAAGAKGERDRIFAHCYGLYDAHMKACNVLDFDDLILLPTLLLQRNEEVRERWQNKIRYLLVDEYQDTNTSQYELVKLLVGQRARFTVVGDDDQSIYGFRGAKPDVCRMFTQIYKEAEIFRLNMNYRCCETIVNASLSLINHNKNRFYKNLKAFNKGGNSVEYYNFNDISKQDDFVTGYVYNKIYNDTSSDSDESIAILTRTNAEASEFKHKLQKHGLNILYCGNQSDFFDKWVVKDVIAYLRISVGDYRRQNFIRIINKPQRYISRMYFTDENTGFNTLEDNIRCRGSKENLEEIIKLQCHVKNMNTMIPFAAVNYVRKVVGYDRYLHEYASERGTDVKIFLDIIEKLQNISKSFDNLKQFIEYVDNVSEDNVNDADGLGKADESKTHLCSVSTMHRAKGLEFDTVIIVSANEKNIPYCKAVSLEQLEEERRLFYVALTRAKKKLIICSVQKQYNRKMQSSRFIRELHL